MQPQKIERTELGGGNKISGKNFLGHHISDLNAKKFTFEDCTFSACIIERGYFHEAKFVKCKFVGARFKDCNFRQATFEQCEFDYSDFNRCVIPVPQILGNLPVHSNVRWELIHNLKANQCAIGDIRHDSELIKKEIEAEIAHWRDVRKRPSSYYKKYDNFPDQANAWFQCRRLWIERYVWGHGESLTRLIISTTLFLCMIALIHCIHEINETDSLKLFGSTLFKSSSFIAKLFVDLPVNQWDVDKSPILSTVAVFVRYLFIGLAIPVLYKKIAKR